MSPLRRGAVLVRSLPLRRGTLKRKGSWLGVKMGPLDRIWSAVIHARDQETCRMCHRQKRVGLGMEAAHLFSRVKHSVRYDEDDGFLLCRWDHRWAGAHYERFHEWARRQLGLERYNRLLVRSNLILKVDEEATRLHLNERLKYYKAKEVLYDGR